MIEKITQGYNLAKERGEMNVLEDTTLETIGTSFYSFSHPIDSHRLIDLSKLSKEIYRSIFLNQ
jgi:hypothetical protein